MRLLSPGESVPRPSRTVRRTGLVVASTLLVLLANLAPAATASGATPPGRAGSLPAEGYRAVASDGGVFDFGTNHFLGSRWTKGISSLSAPVSSMAPTPDGRGYWLVGTDGGIFAFGDAHYYGALPARHVTPASAIVSMAPTPDGRGYWLVAANGGVFAFGDARHLGSLPARRIVPTARIVSVAATPDGRGYWLAGADGHVYAFGDAHLYGSMRGRHLAAPIVAIASAFTGVDSTKKFPGYWLLGADGGVFSFGAPFHGSLPSRKIRSADAVGITPTVDNGGYWIATADGSVTSFGDAPFLGDFHTQEASRGTPGRQLYRPWVGLTTVAPPGARAPTGAHLVVSLAFARGTTAKQLLGTTAGFDVTVTADGRRDASKAVAVVIRGANPLRLKAVTDRSGKAEVSYSGAASGTDTVQAEVGAAGSNRLVITWGKPVTVAATSEVHGNFFAEPAGQTTFVARPGDKPAFGETFADVAFNPPEGLLPIPPGAPSPATVPFTDVVTDVGGAYAGVQPATGHGYQAGAATTAGDLTNFDSVLTGSLTVSKPGYLTLGVVSADGFLFGVGRGASSFSGVRNGVTSASVTPFQSYPMMAANDSCLPASVGGVGPQPSDFPVTIHLPAAGSYPYELDYFSCDTQSNAAPLRSLVLRAESLSATAPSAPTIYVGYADTTRLPNNEFHYFPYPWAGSPGVGFEGCDSCGGYDDGAIRIDNTTNKPLTIDDLQAVFNATKGPYAPYSCTFDIWPNLARNDPVTLAPGSTAIYAEESSQAAGCTNSGAFDTSDVPTTSCTESQIIPVVKVTVGATTKSYTDAKQILNTGGFDVAVCEPSYKSNESTPWTRLGGPGTGADVPLPPVASLTLAPIAAIGGGPLTDEVGVTQNFTVSATGSDGNPIAGLPVTLAVTGANPQRLQATTSARGIASFSYSGQNAGTDTLAAVADDQGLELGSGQTAVTWQIPVPGGGPSGGTPGEAPPTIHVSLPAGTSVAVPTPVTGQITPPSGEKIASWSVQLTPANSGQSAGAITLASGRSSPPATLATLDPTQLDNGTYDLAVTAAASGGGTITDSEQVLIAGGFKPGRYEATYQDLSFPAPGFSVGVQRVYDSIDKSVGDFGVGWRLQLSDWSVGLSSPLGAGGWTASATGCSLFGCNYKFESSIPHSVTLTGPSGSQQIFDFTPSGGAGPLYFLAGNPGSFSPAPDTSTVGSLTVYNDPGLYYGFDGNLYNAALAGSGIYDPTEFVYTEPDGTQLLLSMTGGLLDELQSDGNCLNFSTSGIASYVGATSLAGCGGGTAGAALTINRDGLGRVTSIVTPTGATYTYTYDAAGDLVTVTPPAPTADDTYTYDAAHDLLTQHGPGTPLTTLTYDSSGRLVKVTDAAGHTTTITNDLGQRQVVVGDPNGKLSTVYTYDANGYLVSEDRTAGGVTLSDSWTYDANGNPITHTDPSGHTTKATYDGSGNMTSFTDATGNTTTLGYNSLAEVTSETGPTGTAEYSATYNTAGELLSSIAAGGATTTYTYYPDGQVETATNPDGQVTSYSYDASGNLTSVTDAAGHATTMSYDAMGDVTSTTNGNGNVTAYSYDAEGRLLTVTDGAGHVTSRFAYTPLGQVASQTDGNGKVTTFAYSPTTGHLISRTDPDGVTIDYSYNADGQTTAVTAPDGSGSTFSYDAFGRLVGADNATTPVSFAYDPSGDLVSQTSGGGGSAQPRVTLTYGYDATGNRTSITGPAGTTRYGYDAQSQLTSITDPSGGVFGFAYNPGEQVTSMTQPNNGVVGSTYDASGNLTARTFTMGSQTLHLASYSYGASGLVTSSNAGSSSYDGANQLTSVSIPGVSSQSYTYDAAGNRLSSTSNGAVTSMTYNAADQLVSSAGASGTTSITYNGEGEQTSAATGSSRTAYHWNDLGQLVSATTPSGTTRYAYDALGRRVEVEVPGNQVTRYVYDGSNPVLTYDGSNSLVASFTNGVGMHTPLEVTVGGQHYQYLTDAAGSVVGLMDSKGNFVDRYTYDAFGNTTTLKSSVANPFAYTGQPYDASDGLYYEGARYYDPATGRFLSPDPVLGPNPYPYVGNDPTNLVDPTGAEALVETAYISLYQEQLNIAQQIQKLVACLSSQLLYLSLAMDGNALAAPSLSSQINAMLPGLATSTVESQIGITLSLSSPALGDSAYSGVATASAYTYPYLISPSKLGQTAVSQGAGLALSATDIPSGLPGFFDQLSSSTQVATRLAQAANAAANGDGRTLCRSIHQICSG